MGNCIHLHLFSTNKLGIAVLTVKCWSLSAVFGTLNSGHRQSPDINCTLNSLLLFPPQVKATQWCPDAEMNLEARRLLLKAREKLLGSFSYFKKLTVPVVEMQNAINYFVNFWSYSTLQSIWICQRMQAK